MPRWQFIPFVFALLAVPVCAQTPDAGSSPSATPSSSNTNSSPPPAKKVWTNDDIAHGKGGLSVVGDKRNQNYHMTANKPADPATVARIKKELGKLQSQLNDVNKKLQTYKEFQQGEAVSSGARDMSKAYSRTPVDQQITQLLEKKKQLESQMDELLDEARKKGIDPGQLRD